MNEGQGKSIPIDYERTVDMLTKQIAVLVKENALLNGAISALRKDWENNAAPVKKDV